MTTYRSIPDAEITVGSPVQNTTMQSLKDNVDAVFEGDDTSPPIQMAAITRTTPTAGDNIILELHENIGGDDTSILGFGVRTDGIYRIKIETKLAEHAVDSNSNTISSNHMSLTIEKIAISGIKSTLFTHTDGTSSPSGPVVHTTVSDEDLDAGEKVNIIADMTGVYPLGNIIMTVSVDDSDAMWGAEVYGIL